MTNVRSPRRGVAFVVLIVGLAMYMSFQTSVLWTPDTAETTFPGASTPLRNYGDRPIPPENLFVWTDESEPADGTINKGGTLSRTSQKERTPQQSHDSSSSSEDAHSDIQKQTEAPGIIWLASYPNSGTSYTMTMVERSTNRSTATNYGAEIATAEKDDSVPLNSAFPQGPFWEGLSGKRGNTIRDLPATFVLTKTHCGGRCVNCPAREYVADEAAFLEACQRTSGYRTEKGQNGVRFYGKVDTERVRGVIHLIRNPFTNIVARYHLERRHLVQKNPALELQWPNNATGFQRWCRYLDETYGENEAEELPEKIVSLMKDVPCRAEFFKYAQWHSRLVDVLPQLGKTLTVHYSDYEMRFNETVSSIMDFLQQQITQPIRPFRPLPTYSDHYTDAQRKAARKLVKVVSSSEVWSMIRQYFY